METNMNEKKCKTGAQRLVWWGWLLVLVPVALLAISYLGLMIVPDGTLYSGLQSVGILGIAGGVALSPFGVLFLAIGYIKRFFELKKNKNLANRKGFLRDTLSERDENGK